MLILVLVLMGLVLVNITTLQNRQWAVAVLVLHPSGCSTSFVQLFTDVCSTRHHSTWLTAAPTPRTLLVGSTCGLPAGVSCSCLDTGVQCSVVGPFLWLTRRPGTRYQTIFETRRVLLTVFDATWKLFFSRSTSVHSALGALRLCAI